MATAIEPLCLQAEAGEDTWPVHDGQGELLGHIDYHDALDNRRNLQPMEADGTTSAPTLYADWPDDTREEAEIYICDLMHNGQGATDCPLAASHSPTASTIRRIRVQ